MFHRILAMQNMLYGVQIHADTIPALQIQVAKRWNPKLLCKPTNTSICQQFWWF